MYAFAQGILCACVFLVVVINPSINARSTNLMWITAKNLGRPQRSATPIQLMMSTLTLGICINVTRLSTSFLVGLGQNTWVWGYLSHALQQAQPNAEALPAEPFGKQLAKVPEGLTSSTHSEVVKPVSIWWFWSSIAYCIQSEESWITTLEASRVRHLC